MMTKNNNFGVNVSKMRWQCPNVLSAIGLNFSVRMGGRDGWRDAEERDGVRQKSMGGGAQQLALFFFFFLFPCHYPRSLFQSAPFDESQIVH